MTANIVVNDITNLSQFLVGPPPPTIAPNILKDVPCCGGVCSEAVLTGLPSAPAGWRATGARPGPGTRLGPVYKPGSGPVVQEFIVTADLVPGVEVTNMFVTGINKDQTSL